MTKRKKQEDEPVALFEQIPDSAENIAKALMVTPPKKSGDWRFMKRKKSA